MFNLLNYAGSLARRLAAVGEAVLSFVVSPRTAFMDHPADEAGGPNNLRSVWFPWLPQGERDDVMLRILMTTFFIVLSSAYLSRVIVFEVLLPRVFLPLIWGSLSVLGGCVISFIGLLLG